MICIKDFLFSFVLLYQCSCSHFLEVESDGGVCWSKDCELACLFDFIRKIVILKKAESIQSERNNFYNVPGGDLSCGLFTCSYHEVRSEQRELGPEGKSRQEAFTQLPVWNQNLGTEKHCETSWTVSLCGVTAQLASDLVNDVDQPIGGSDVCHSHSCSSNICKLRQQNDKCEHRNVSHPK